MKLKTLYCYYCNNQLSHGHRESKSFLCLSPIFYFECNHCDFFIQGREAEVLFVAFVNDLI